jgi:hypothetical protein
MHCTAHIYDEYIFIYRPYVYYIGIYTGRLQRRIGIVNTTKSLAMHHPKLIKESA